MFKSDATPSFKSFTNVLSLILIAGGIWMSYSALVMAFSPPDYADLLGRLNLSPAQQTALEDIQPQGAMLMRQAMTTFLIQGLLPILVGCLMMRLGRQKSLRRSGAGIERSALRRFFMPRMSFALARIEDEIESGYRPFTLGS